MKVKKNERVLKYFEGLKPSQVREMRERTLAALADIRADIDNREKPKEKERTND